MSDSVDVFEEFTEEDFDAYLSEKWNSNVYTLPRRRVKSKLNQLGLALNEELKNGDLALVQHLSDEFPSLWNKKRVDVQWLFFSRDEAARKELSDLVDTERTLADTLHDPTPRYRHIFMGAALDATHLEIGLRLPFDAWVDRRNLLNLLEKNESTAKFCHLLNDLPSHYEVGLAASELSSPNEMDESAVQALAKQFNEAKGWLFIGARMPRDQVLVLESDVVDVAREVFRLVTPLYRFMAWSADNDAISFDSLVAKRHQALQANKAEFDQERAEREARRAERQKQHLALKEELEERVRENQAWLRRETAIQRAQQARAAQQSKQDDARAEAEAIAAKWGLGKSKDEPNRPKSRPPGTPQPLEHKAPTPAATPKTAEVQSTSAKTTDNGIQVGMHVKVLSGFLSGRRGVVQDIDEKGGIRVAFGSLISRLSLNEVNQVDPPAQRPKERTGTTSRKPSKR